MSEDPTLALKFVLAVITLVAVIAIDRLDKRRDNGKKKKK